MGVRGFLSLVVAAAMIAVAPAAARTGASSFVLQADRSIGGLEMGRGTPSQAVARFGTPALRRSRPPSCLVAWPRIGLTISFLDFAGKPCKDGVAARATITSRTRWRTLVGLRVGDAVPRIRKLYPQASRHTGEFGGTNGFWLITRRSCEEVGGAAYPALLARLRNGRVSAIVSTLGVCE